MIKLVIFDLDGTLLNTLEDLKECTNYILRKYHFPEHPLDSYRYFVGNGITVLIEKAIPPGTSDQLKKQILQDFLVYYDIHKADITKPYPGIVSLLETLQDKGIQLAVASNKIHEAMAPLMKHYFPSIDFLAAYGSKEGVPPKPHPQIVEDIISLTNLDHSQILYVGDTKVDMDTAHHANLKAVGVLWGFRDRDELEGANADFIISKPEELLQLI